MGGPVDGTDAAAGGPGRTTTGTQEPLPPPPPPAAARPPLRRRTDDRMVAGIASGLAAHLGLDVALVRVAVVALAFAFPPVGLAYLAAWLLVEEASPADAPPAPPRRDRDAGFWIGAGLLVVVALALVGEIGPFGRGLWPLLLIALGVAFWRAQADEDGAASAGGAAAIATGVAPTGPAPATGEVAAAPPPTVRAPVRFDPPPARPRSVVGRVTLALAAIAAGGVLLLDRLGGVALGLVGGAPWPLSRLGQLGPVTPMAVALLVIGIGLVVSAFVGRARWLILVGLVLLPGVVLGGIARGYDVPLRGGVRDVDLHVAEVSALPLGGIEQAAGEIVLDLTELQLGAGEDVVVPVRLGAGSVEVRVPADLSLDVQVEVLAGSVSLPGARTTEGIRLELGHATTGGVGASGVLRLPVTVGVGEVRIVEVAIDRGTEELR
ncbi:MAG: PspC domain-containing protein [Actinomycetes bacterium]